MTGYIEELKAKFRLIRAYEDTIKSLRIAITRLPPESDRTKTKLQKEIQKVKLEILKLKGV